MKIGELTDISICESDSQLVIELPNGQRISTNGYSFGESGNGDGVVILKAGRKISKSRSYDS